MTEKPEFLTTKAVAKILNVNYLTVWREIRRGRLKGIKIAGDYRIKRTDLDEYLEKNTVKPEGKND